MNFTEEIKKEARLEGWQKGQKEGWQKGRQEGQQEGWQKGQKEGWQKRNEEIILKMLKNKLEIPFISEVTGLSEREIKKLKNGA